METINTDPKPVVVQQAPKPDHTGAFIAIFVILALLIIGEVYSLGRFSSLRTELSSQQAKADQQLNADLSNKVQQLQNANAQALDQLRAELDSTATSMSANEKKALRNAGYAGVLVRKLQKEEAQNTQKLQATLATKADQQQLASITQDAAATKTDLARTKTNVSTIASDLGMARSGLGTLIATNHQDIVTLQKLGSRDYFEFTLNQNEKKTVGGVALTLRHASMGHHTFNMDMFYSDMKVTRKNLAIDQPVFFAPKYTHNFYEMVVYQIGPHFVKGYVSTPKGAVQQEMASSAQ
ncbi:MAG: hypothetical protein ACRD2G_04035 [Terriglobia bacterium]